MRTEGWLVGLLFLSTDTLILKFILKVVEGKRSLPRGGRGQLLILRRPTPRSPVTGSLTLAFLTIAGHVWFVTKSVL